MRATLDPVEYPWAADLFARTAGRNCAISKDLRIASITVCIAIGIGARVSTSFSGGNLRQIIQSSGLLVTSCGEITGRHTLDTISVRFTTHDACDFVWNGFLWMTSGTSSSPIEIYFIGITYKV